MESAGKTCKYAGRDFGEILTELRHAPMSISEVDQSPRRAITKQAPPRRYLASIRRRTTDCSIHLRAKGY
jgi:hypothetical protein